MASIQDYMEQMIARGCDGKRLVPDFAMKPFDSEVESFYESLSACDTRALCEYAFSRSADFAEWLTTFVLNEFQVTVVGREIMKNPQRVSDKLSMNTRPDRFFKAHCDMMAFRVITESVTDMPMLCDRLSKSGCVFAQRPTYNNEPDLVRFCYVFRPEDSLVAEVQIIHPFAANVFKADSAMRNGTSTADFWKDNFYTQVKEQIMSGELTMSQMQEAVSALESGVEIDTKCYKFFKDFVGAGDFTLAELRAVVTTPV